MDLRFRPLRDTAGRDVFLEFFVTDPPLGRPLSGGIHRTWERNDPPSHSYTTIFIGNIKKKP
jgi:hypothetical protein